MQWALFLRAYAPLRRIWDASPKPDAKAIFDANALNPPVAEIDPDVINTEKIKEVLPGMPCEVIGFSDMPHVGDEVVVMNSERDVIPGAFNPVQSWQGKNYFLGYEHCDVVGKHWFWTAGDEARP